MKEKLKKVVLILLVGIFLLIVGRIWQNSQWVMKVNDQKVSKPEYTFYQRLYPRLDDKALEKQIVEDKVLLQQAQRQKIEMIPDYKTLKYELRKINQNNEKRVQKKQVVYGLRKYSEASFYRYSLSTTINELKQSVAKDITINMMRDYYKNHKSEFKEIDAKEIYRVSGEKATLEQLCKEVTTQEQLTARSEVITEQVKLNESTLRDWIKYREADLSIVNKLAVGEWSTLFSNANNTWSYYCLTNKMGEVQSFDEVKEKIALRLEKERYQANLKTWVKQAEVKSNREK